MKKASIIIPTRNKSTRLLLVLQALGPQIDEKVEVIIVLDGCTQSTIQDILSFELSFKPEYIILDTNRGRAAARNEGIKRAVGEILIFLDDDRIPAPDFVSKHIQAHRDQNEKPCIVLGKRLNIDFADEMIDKMYKQGEQKIDYDFLEKRIKIEKAANLNYLFSFYPTHPCRWIACYTGNMSVKRNILIKVGLFDEKFKGWGFEDSELGYRFVQAGIPFRMDKKIVNYHILHNEGTKSRLNDFLGNYQYFRNKVRRDTLAKIVLSVNKLFFMIAYCYEGINRFFHK